jgi:hypothetical protein
MSPFEYVIVLVSIILGLGITTILTGLAELIKHKQLKWYGPYIIWLFLVFILHIHEWWESYTLKSVEVWKLPMFLFIILYPINLYVLAHLLFPSDLKSDFNPKDFYLSNYPKFFISAIISVTLSIIHNITIESYHLKDQIVHFVVLIILISFLIAKPKSKGAHIIVSVFFLMILIVSLILTRDSLIITN